MTARVLMSVVVVSVLAGCAPPERDVPPPPLVTIAKPRVADVTRTDVFIASTEAIQTVDVRARIEGWLETIDFIPSDFVEEGDLLFTIEPTNYQLAVDRAEAALALAKAELKRADADLERVKEAVKTDAVSVQEVSLRQADRDKAAASVDSAQAELRDAKLDLGYTRVLAPIGGRVDRNLVDVGNLVGSGERTLLTTVRDVSRIYVYFDISEQFVVDYLRKHGIRRDAKELEGDLPIAAALTGDSAPGETPPGGAEPGDPGREFPHKGHIDYVSNTVDPATGTVRVRGVFDNTKGLLYPGLTARVVVPGDTVEDAVLVRETAIGTDLQGKYVFTLAEPDAEQLTDLGQDLPEGSKIAVRAAVELGQLEGEWRVIESGLEAGQDYIVDGTVYARAGRPVRVQTEAEAAKRNGN